MSTANFTLLLKNEIEKNKTFLIEAFNGYLLIRECNQFTNVFKIKYENYELFFKNFLLIFEFFLENKQFMLNFENLIKEDSDLKTVWIPYQNNSEKIIVLKHIKKNDLMSIFEIHFALEDFFYFIKSFSHCFLPSLLLKEDEKLMFHLILSKLFDWSLFSNDDFCDEYLITFIRKYKEIHCLSIDISNIILLFKVYYPLLYLLNKAEDLKIICLNGATIEAQVLVVKN